MISENSTVAKDSTVAKASVVKSLIYNKKDTKIIMRSSISSEKGDGLLTTAMLSSILRDQEEYPLTLEVYTDYCKNVTHDVENVEFYKRYLKLLDQIPTKEEFEQIMLTFILPGSEMELNIDGNISKPIIDAFYQSPDTMKITLFEPAAKKVFDNMYENSFKRFIKKYGYQNLGKEGQKERFVLFVVAGLISIGLTIYFCVAKVHRYWRFVLIVPLLASAAGFWQAQKKVCFVIAATGKNEMGKAHQFVMVRNACVKRTQRQIALGIIRDAFLTAAVLLAIIFFIPEWS